MLVQTEEFVGVNNTQYHRMRQAKIRVSKGKDCRINSVLQESKDAHEKFQLGSEDFKGNNNFLSANLNGEMDSERHLQEKNNNEIVDHMQQ